MWKNSIIFSGITLMLLVFSINSLNNDVSLELLLENSRPHIGAVYPSEIGIGGETINKTLEALINAGLNVARLNYSHGNLEQKTELIENACKE